MKRTLDHEEVIVFLPPGLITKRWKPNQTIDFNPFRPTAPSASPTAADEQLEPTKIVAINNGSPSREQKTDRVLVLDLTPRRQPKARPGRNGSDGHHGITGRNGREASHVSH
jgi:hypothetical protein